jgi:hypothetical protein
MYLLHQAEQSEQGWIPLIQYQSNGNLGVWFGRYFFSTKQQALRHCHELERELFEHVVMRSS